MKYDPVDHAIQQILNKGYEIRIEYRVCKKDNPDCGMALKFSQDDKTQPQLMHWHLQSY